MTDYGYGGPSAAYREAEERLYQEREALKARVAELEAENAALKKRLYIIRTLEELELARLQASASVSEAKTLGDGRGVGVTVCHDPIPPGTDTTTPARGPEEAGTCLRCDEPAVTDRRCQYHLDRKHLDNPDGTYPLPAERPRASEARPECRCVKCPECFTGRHERCAYGCLTTEEPRPNEARPERFAAAQAKVVEQYGATFQRLAEEPRTDYAQVSDGFDPQHCPACKEFADRNRPPGPPVEVKNELWDAAKLKVKQLEAEIRKYLPYDGVAKANMLHTLSKLWMFATDAWEQEVIRPAQRPETALRPPHPSFPIGARVCVGGDPCLATVVPPKPPRYVYVRFDGEPEHVSHPMTEDELELVAT